MASPLHDHINSFTLERGIEFDQAYTLTPTRTGSNSNGTYDLAGTTPVYESTDGPNNGSGSWRFQVNRSGTVSTQFNTNSANTLELATFSDNDWTIGIWFKLDNLITSQYSYENEIEIISAAGFRLSVSSSKWTAAQRFMYSTDGSGYSTFQQTGHQAVQTNRWYYLAVRRVGSTWSFYLDGTLVRTLTNATTITPGFFRFGGSGTSGALSSADITYNLSNFHYGTSANLTEAAIQSIWEVGSDKHKKAIQTIGTPLHWFPLDDTYSASNTVKNRGTSATDMALSGSNGTAYQRIAASGAVDGYGLEILSGWSGYNTTTTITYPSANSFSFWFKKASAPAANDTWMYYFVDSQNRINSTSENRIGTDGKIYFNPRFNNAQGSGLVSTNSICDNNWHHIVITRNGSSFKMYVDGSLNSSFTGSTTTLAVGSFNFGMASSLWDEFAYWNDRELTSTEVTNLYSASPYAAININYTNTSGGNASGLMPDPIISLPRNYNSEALTATALFADPAFSTSSPKTVNADVTTASADIVMPTVSLGTNPNAFGVGTASGAMPDPVISTVRNVNYTDTAGANANATSPNAVVTITKAVSYSASPAISSALLGGNVYAGPTVQDIHYDLTIRQIGNTTNTNGTGGFTLGSTWDSNTKLDMSSLAIKPVSGIPSNGSLIKVRIAGSPDITITNQDVNGDNEYNIYVFTANPSTTFDTMTGANLPAKELLYKTRGNDNDSQRLDLTPAFKDSRGQTYGIYIEHVGTPPYSGTVWDRVSYSGSNLNTKALYILTSEFTNVNYNAPAATATGTQTDVSVYVERYINVSESPATASGLAVHPTIITERTVNVAAMETTASAQAVQPAFSGGATYTSDHLEAFAEGLAFIVTTTKNVNVAVDPSTLSALLHMPQAQIGENNTVDHMNASATFPMPLIIFSRTVQPAQLTATALMRDPSITTQQRGTIRAEVMTARTFVVEPRQYFNYANDKWLKRIYDFQNNQSGYPNVPFLKFFTMPTDIIANATPPGSTSFVDRINFNAEAPQGTIANDRIYSFQTSSTPQKFISWASGGSGKLEVGYFDNQNRKAVRINNIAFQNKATFGLPTGTLSNPDTWSLEMMFKATKQNQVLFSAGPLTISGLNNRTFNMGLYNGKFFATHAVGGPGNDRGIYRAFAWDPIYGAANTTEYASTVVGNRVIGDGNWHHVVIQVISGRLQVFVDGDLDFQRYGISNLYPRSFGFGNWSEDANSDFYISALSISPDTYLSDREIDLNNAYANGYAVYEAQPATATLDMTQNNKGRGNRPRALALYWWPKRRAASGAIDRQEDLWDSQGGSKKSEFDYPTFFQTIDYYQQRSQKFYGWDVYAVDVTGSYYSEVVNYDSYSGGVRTFNELIGLGPGQATVTKSARGFRDQITDNRRYIDLINDVDLDQVEAIFFLNYPNESNERDEYSGSESVDDFFNIRESDIYQDFLKSLRAAVDRGINLMVSNSQLALDLGIVDRVEVVDPLIDGVTWKPGGGYNLDGTPRLPEIVGTPQDDYLRSASLVPGKTVQSNFKDGRWHDYAFNNRLRIVNTIPGITDLMYFTLDDIAYFEVNGQYKFGAPPELYTRMIYRPNGATVGTEFIMPDASNVGNPASNDYCRRYLAVPFENVKAGKIVAAFGQTYKRGNETVANPYANYATHIALERGTVLNGKPLGGRIWVTITERPQSSTGTHSEVEMGSDYWIDLAFNLGLITAGERTAYKADPKNINRALERGEVTQEFYNKYMYWSELGFNQSTTVSQGLQSAASQAVQAFGQLFEAIFTGAQKQSAEEAGLSRFFNYSGTGIIAMVQNFYSFKKVAVPTVTLNGAAFGWIANKEVVPGTQVRDVAGTASAMMVQPTVVGDKLVAQNAQAMLATADVKDPTNFTWTQKDNNYVSLPMLASALINPKLTLIQAASATANAALPQNISAYTTDVDEVILYINHVDPILYLREDIVK